MVWKRISAQMKIITALTLITSKTLSHSVSQVPSSKMKDEVIEMEITENPITLQDSPPRVGDEGIETMIKDDNLPLSEEDILIELVDLHHDCSELANIGESHLIPEYMLENCITSCLRLGDLGTIGYFLIETKDEQEDNDENDESCINLADLDPSSSKSCEELAEMGKCHLDADYMLIHCAMSCLFCVPADAETFEIGVAQEIIEEYLHDPEHIKETLQVIASTNKYMSTVVMEEPDYDWIRRSCYNYDAHCASMAAAGFCEDDDENDEYYWMITECAPVCQTCDTLEVIELCHPDEESNIFVEGDLDMMFRRIVREIPPADGMVFPDYVPFVHSRPDHPPANVVGGNDYILGPWVVTLENFLSDEECDKIIELGHQIGYKKSELEDEEDEENYRSSTTAWCKYECGEEPVIQNIYERVLNITGIPNDNSEDLQLLKYTEGQYYKKHHDTIEAMYNTRTGPRVLTVFLYLNEVEAGGETRFNDLSGNGTNLQLDVRAKKGMALIWPSVENDPSFLEERTFHEALPVKSGVKFGANVWLHLRKYDSYCEDEDHEKYIEILSHPSLTQFAEQE